MADYMEHIAVLAVVLTVAASGISLIVRFVRWRRFVHQFASIRITPEQLRQKMDAAEDILIVELGGQVNDPAGVVAIPGAVRIDPRLLEQYRDVYVIPTRDVILYCANPVDFTGARVALTLRRKGIDSVYSLDGGLQGWVDSGFPVTSEVRMPPTSSVWVSSVYVA